MAPKHVSAPSFCTANVLIDLKSRYSLMYQRHPVRAFLRMCGGAEGVLRGSTRTSGRFNMNIEKLESAGDIVELLQECSLPVSDLKTDQRHVFFGGFDGGILKSCVGVELFDAMALLRSLAVRPSQRKKGMGAALVSHVETFCKSRGVQAIYLMTTTASPYFARLGYAPVSRESVPASIKVDPKGAPCTFRRRGLDLHQTAKRPSVLTVHNAVRRPRLPSILPFGQGGCRRPSPACVVGLDPRGGGHRCDSGCIPRSSGGKSPARLQVRRRPRVGTPR